MSAIEKRKLMQDRQGCTEQNQSLFDITTMILVSETIQVTSFFDGNISCCNFLFFWVLELSSGTDDEHLFQALHLHQRIKNYFKVPHF